MWKRIFVTFGALVLLSGVTLAVGAESAQEPDAAVEQAAIDASNQWLASVDNGQYDSSWEEACEYFKMMVKKTQWASQLSVARNAFGKVVSRQLDQKKYAKNLPGAPDGEYYVFSYRTAFEGKANSIETLTVQKEKDGKWRVAGYFIN